MKKNIILTAIFCSLFLLAGCSKETQDFTGLWELFSFEEENEVLEFTGATMNIEQSENELKLSGNAGINNYNGKVLLSKKHASSKGPFAITKMLGSQKTMEFEGEFIEALEEINSIKLDKENDELTLECKKSKVILKFRPYSIKAKKWLLFSTLENSTNTPYIIFNKDGTFSTFTSLNIVQGTYEINEEEKILTFETGVSTLVSGTEADMKAESTYLDKLYKTTSFEISGQDLVLKESSGAQTLVFAIQRF